MTSRNGRFRSCRHTSDRRVESREAPEQALREERRGAAHPTTTATGLVLPDVDGDAAGDGDGDGPFDCPGFF